MNRRFPIDGLFVLNNFLLKIFDLKDYSLVQSIENINKGAQIAKFVFVMLHTRQNSIFKKQV